MAVRFKQLSKTSTEWASLNPTLLEGEIGFEKDTNKLKIGDGVSNWNTLEYTIGDNSSEIDTSNFVDLTSEQTITGVKTFDSNLLFSTNSIQLKYATEQDDASIFIGNYNKSDLTISDRNIFIGNNILSPWGGCENIFIGTNVFTETNSNRNIIFGSGHNSGKNGISIGHNSVISISSYNSQGDYGISIGYNANYKAANAIQLGTGTNNTAKTLQVWDYQLLDGNTGLIPNERLNLGTKKYLHRITLNLSDQVSGTAPTKMAVIHLDYYSEQETAYTNPNFATIALANSIRCSGYYTDTDTSLTEKNFVYEIALPQSNEFVLNSSFSITTQSTGSSITDEVIGYIFS